MTIRKICSYTHRNITRTPIEVSDALRMTCQHSYLSPLILQGLQSASPSGENQQQFDLYQGPRICRSKKKASPQSGHSRMDVYNPFPAPLDAWTALSQPPTSNHIKYAHLTHVLLKDDIGHETSDQPSNDVPAESAASLHISPESSLTHSSYKSCKKNANISKDFGVL